MAKTVRIVASVSLIITGGEAITLDELQSFIEEAKRVGIPTDKPLGTKIMAPYNYDQRDYSPGSFTINAAGD